VRALATHDDEVRRCYMRSLQRDPKLRGAVQVRFVIGADGAVSNVGMPWLRFPPYKDRRKTEQAVLPDEATTACVAGAIEGLSFPRPAVTQRRCRCPSDGSASAAAQGHANLVARAAP
jgi:hypothetical protein